MKSKLEAIRERNMALDRKIGEILSKKAIEAEASPPTNSTDDDGKGLPDSKEERLLAAERRRESLREERLAKIRERNRELDQKIKAILEWKRKSDSEIANWDDLHTAIEEAERVSLTQPLDNDEVVPVPTPESEISSVPHNDTTPRATNQGHEFTVHAESASNDGFIIVQQQAEQPLDCSTTDILSASPPESARRQTWRREPIQIANSERLLSPPMTDAAPSANKHPLDSSLLHPSDKASTSPSTTTTATATTPTTTPTTSVKRPNNRNEPPVNNVYKLIMESANNKRDQQHHVSPVLRRLMQEEVIQQQLEGYRQLHQEQPQLSDIDLLLVALLNNSEACFMSGDDESDDDDDKDKYASTGRRNTPSTSLKNNTRVLKDSRTSITARTRLRPASAVAKPKHQRGNAVIINANTNVNKNVVNINVNIVGSSSNRTSSRGAPTPAHTSSSTTATNASAGASSSSSRTRTSPPTTTTTNTAATTAKGRITTTHMTPLSITASPPRVLHDHQQQQQQQHTRRRWNLEPITLQNSFDVLVPSTTTTGTPTKDSIFSFVVT